MNARYEDGSIYEAFKDKIERHADMLGLKAEIDDVDSHRDGELSFSVTITDIPEEET